MKNKILSLFLLICLLFSLFILSSCKKKDNDLEIKESGKPFTTDFYYLYGLGETPFDLCPDVDSALTTEWIASRSKVLGIKAYRIWAYINYMFEVDEFDNLTMNMEYAERLHNFCSQMKDAGVERFSLLTASRIQLKEYQGKYAQSCVPDPTSEYDKYLRCLKIEEKAYEMMAKEFPEIEYFECINEPDHYLGTAVNKNGFVYNPFDSSANADYMFTTDETARVIMDFCYYVRRGIKKGNPNGKLLLPALCHFASTPDFLERIYKAICGGCLPAGEAYSDTDPDNYFDVLNWHPYLNDAFGTTSTMGELWIQRQNDIHDIAVKYGDAEKPVWFTEYGFSDGGDLSIFGSVSKDSEKGIAPLGLVECFKTIKESLPFVETVFMFRLTDMYLRKYDVESENTFGLFFNKEDPINVGKPKPEAVAFYRYSKGELSYDDMKELCIYYYEKYGDIPEEYKCVITK